MRFPFFIVLVFIFFGLYLVMAWCCKYIRVVSVWNQKDINVYFHTRLNTLFAPKRWYGKMNHLALQEIARCMFWESVDISSDLVCQRFGIRVMVRPSVGSRLAPRNLVSVWNWTLTNRHQRVCHGPMAINFFEKVISVVSLRSRLNLTLWWNQ